MKPKFFSFKNLNIEEQHIEQDDYANNIHHNAFMNNYQINNPYEEARSKEIKLKGYYKSMLRDTFGGKSSHHNS